MSTAENDELLTPSEVAKIFKVDPKTVTRWGQKGLISSFKTPGGHRRFKRTDVEKLIKESNGSV